jgi:hypothetical protein
LPSDGRTVSIAILVPLLGIILGTSIFSRIFSILVLALVCLAIMVVNIMFMAFNKLIRPSVGAVDALPRPINRRCGHECAAYEMAGFGR